MALIYYTFHPLTSKSKDTEQYDAQNSNSIVVVSCAHPIRSSEASSPRKNTSYTIIFLRHQQMSSFRRLTRSRPLPWPVFVIWGSHPVIFRNMKHSSCLDIVESELTRQDLGRGGENFDPQMRRLSFATAERRAQ